MKKISYDTCFFFITTLCIIGLTACRQVQPPESPSLPSTPSMSVTQTSSVEIIPAQNNPQQEISDPIIWFDPNIPDLLISEIVETGNYIRGEDKHRAEYIISPNSENVLITRWKYFITAPFFCNSDSISSDEFRTLWTTGTGDISQPPAHLIMTVETKGMLSSVLGTSSDIVLTEVTGESLLKIAWQDKECKTWAILPFETLQQEWKIIMLDEQDPFLDSTDLLTISVFSNKELSSSLPFFGNFDPENMTTLNMTGVTALVRATAATMEKQGLLYPAENIGEILRNADFTHVSNEISFADDCPYPKYQMDELKFCSSPEYVSLLEEIGGDIVELTGDHLEDWGVNAFLNTLDLYKQRNWLIYGGGENLAAAQQALHIDHHGNHLVFLGCNAKSPAYAHAAADYPGTWFCDWSLLGEQIKTAREQGDLPIVTIQHKEYDQAYPTPEIINDFQFIADQGAVLVLGSQAHQPQTFDFSHQAFIHYGLGNLFFDQYNESLENRDAFIDHFTFYNNRLINVRLYTSVFIDWAKPRWMTSVEREMFLNRIFTSSNWDIEFK